MAEREEVVRRGAAEEFEFVGFRLSWGAIFAGLVTAVVVQVILSLLGLAIGFGALNFQAAQPFQGVSIGAAIWAIVTVLLSLFAGGLVAGHLAGVLSRFDGALHGMLVWGLSVIVAIWAVSTGVSTILGGIFGVAGQTVAATISGAGRVGAAAVANVDTIPAGQADQQVVAILEQQGLSEQRARQAAAQIEQARTSVQLQAEQIQREAPQVATQVAGTLSTALWWTLLAAVLSLAAAALGAAITAES